MAFYKLNTWSKGPSEVYRISSLSLKIRQALSWPGRLTEMRMFLSLASAYCKAELELGRNRLSPS